MAVKTFKPVRILTLFALMAVLAAIAFSAVGQVSANPPGKPTVWVDDVLYNAIVPMGPHGPVLFPHVPDADAPNIATLETTDNLYMVPSNTMAPLVSDSAPGDVDYNGGRWVPFLVTYIGLGVAPEFESEEEILLAHRDLCPRTTP